MLKLKVVNMLKIIVEDYNNISINIIVVNIYAYKAIADGPVGQVLAGPVSECNK